LNEKNNFLKNEVYQLQTMVSREQETIQKVLAKA